MNLYRLQKQLFSYHTPHLSSKTLCTFTSKGTTAPRQLCNCVLFLLFQGIFYTHCLNLKIYNGCFDNHTKNFVWKMFIFLQTKIANNVVGHTCQILQLQKGHVAKLLTLAGLWTVFGCLSNLQPHQNETQNS